MPTTSLYVDGFNLYHAINDLGDPRLKWLDLRALAKSYLEKRDTLVQVVYFTALKPHNPEKYHRHVAYIDALEATGVEVVRSKFLRNKKYCHTNDRYCKLEFEKQTDVALAIRILSDIQSRTVERAILVTADSDHVPLAKHIRDAYPGVDLQIAPPPGRGREARELCKEATRFKEISAGRLARCLFPRTVMDDSGTVAAICPAKYQ